MNNYTQGIVNIQKSLKTDFLLIVASTLSVLSGFILFIIADTSVFLSWRAYIALPVSFAFSLFIIVQITKKNYPKAMSWILLGLGNLGLTVAWWRLAPIINTASETVIMISAVLIVSSTFSIVLAIRTIGQKTDPPIILA